MTSRMGARAGDPEMNPMIESIRHLKALVIQARSPETEELIRQIRRIGCEVGHLVSVPRTLPEGVDILFLEVTDPPDDNAVRLLSTCEPEAPTVVGIIGYENPSVLRGVVDMQIDTVMAKPVRPFGVLSHMLMARRVWSDRRRAETDIRRLKKKIQASRTISDAKVVLMRMHGIDEREAYQVIRNQAMAKRTTTVEIAQSVVNAESLLAGLAPSSEKD